MCVPGTLETVRERVEREGPPRVSRRMALLAGAGTIALDGAARRGVRARAGQRP